MIEIKRIQQQPDLAKAIYAVMAAIYPVSPWTLEQIQADLSKLAIKKSMAGMRVIL